MTVNLFDLVAQKDKNKHFNLHKSVKIFKMVIQLHISSIASLIHLVAVKPYWHMKGQNPSVILPEFRCFASLKAYFAVVAKHSFTLVELIYLFKPATYIEVWTFLMATV